MERAQLSPFGGSGAQRNFFYLGGPARTQRSGSRGERRKEWSVRSFRHSAEAERSDISSDALSRRQQKK